MGLAYLHLIEPRVAGGAKSDELRSDVPSASELFRRSWPGVLVVAGGYDGPTAERAVSSGDGDAVAFGRAFISTPDLVERVRIGAAFNPWHRPTFYGGDSTGYTDYPSLEAVGAD
ncbi:2,4-dienoyl-CoA reductase-like NADH-dependent reductase (Old Yellow Enzyme family) [Bradyrhizobium sp. USDA 4486]